MKNLSTPYLSITSGLFSCALLACGSPDEAPCDPNVANTICTIVGNGNNGYDQGADDEAVPALDARMSLPQDTLTDPDRGLYLLDWNNHRLRLLSDDGMLSWIAGRGELGGSLDDPASGDFNHPTNMVFEEGSSRDAIIIAAWHNSQIRRIDVTNSTVTEVAGNGGRAYFGDGEDADSSTMDLPASIAYSPDGELTVMDQANQVIRIIRDDGTIERIAGQCVLENLVECAPGDNLVACPDRADGSPSGKLTCGDPEATCVDGVLGACTPSYVGDDDGMAASDIRISQPFGQSAAPAGRIAYAPNGDLYFADTGNHMIRRITPEGMVFPVAGVAPIDGVPQAGYGGDGGPALDAQLNFPVDLAFDDAGNLYFSDVFNHCIRKIDTTGGIESVAGQCGVSGFEGDGGDPSEALLLRPFGVEWHKGRLNISDTGNNRIRTILLEEGA